MKILLIGGTGIISTAVSRTMLEKGHELWLINRGTHNDVLPAGVHFIIGDINDTDAMKSALKGHYFDCVADFTVLKPEQINRDYQLFKSLSAVMKLRKALPCIIPIGIMPKIRYPVKTN